MIIITMPVGRVDTNAYILHNERNLQAILIDPGTEADRILSRAKAQNFNIIAILLTHGHFDHIGAADEIAKHLGIKIYASKEDATLAADPELNGSRLLMREDITCTATDFVQDKQVLDFGWIKLDALHTPGHTAGHICYLVKQSRILFTGDLLFKDGYGRYDLPTSNLADLKKSLNRLFALPKDVQVYPGHGQPTTIEFESRFNPILDLK